MSPKLRVVTESKIINPQCKLGSVGPAQLSIIAKHPHLVMTTRTAGIDTRLPAGTIGQRVEKKVKRFGGR